MNSSQKKREIILNQSIKTNLRYLRLVLPLLVSMLPAACDDRIIRYQGTCAQQTQQFMDYVHSVVINEVNPVIEDGFKSGPSEEITKRIEHLDTRVSKINTPECNPGAPAVKDALRQYMLEAKNYFNVVAGRAIYGEGAVQAQLSTMYEAGLAFEIALEDLRK
jgi:hypothetical protein